MKFLNPEEVKDNNEEKEQAANLVPVYSEKAEAEAPEVDEAQIRALALAYARYLKENGLVPGDPTFAEPEELIADGIDEILAAEDRQKSGIGEEEEPAEPEEPAEQENPEDEETHDYVLNTSTMKFHLADCESIDKIPRDHIERVNATRSSIIAQGYEPCDYCNP